MNNINTILQKCNETVDEMLERFEIMEDNKFQMLQKAQKIRNFLIKNNINGPIKQKCMNLIDYIEMSLIMY